MSEAAGIPEGSWGAAGQIVRFEQLRELALAEREKAGEAVTAGG